MMLRKIIFLLTIVAIPLLVAACGPSIETEHQALDRVIDYLNNKSFNGENCLALVMEESEEAGWEYNDGKSIWETKKAADWSTIDEGFLVARRFDRPNGHFYKGGMPWHVKPDGSVITLFRYPPC